MIRRSPHTPSRKIFTHKIFYSSWLAIFAAACVVSQGWVSSSCGFLSRRWARSFHDSLSKDCSSAWVVSSKGYRWDKGWLVRPQAVLTIAAHETLSTPVSKFSTTPNFQRVLGRTSSWIRTKFPTRGKVETWNWACWCECRSQSAARYSCWNLLTKCKKSIAWRLAIQERSDTASSKSSSSPAKENWYNIN